MIALISKIDGKVSATVLFVIAGAVLGGYLIYQVFRDRDPYTNLCVEVLPRNQRVGIKIEVTGEGLTKIDFSGQKGVEAGATPEQIEKFIKCLEAIKGKIAIENGVRLSLEPVGQVANRWSREDGLKIRLLPGSNDEALNNLRIGPATGLKENVIRAWCGPEQAGNCVTCDPQSPRADTVEVLVRLKDNAPIEKKQLDHVWPAPQAGVPTEPWQIVNAKGERFYYECRRE